MKFKRKFPCAMCGIDYYVDSDDKIGFCKCGIVRKLQIPSEIMLKENFIEISDLEWLQAKGILSPYLHRNP